MQRQPLMTGQERRHLVLGSGHLVVASRDSTSRDRRRASPSPRENLVDRVRHSVRLVVAGHAIGHAADPGVGVPHRHSQGRLPHELHVVEPVSDRRHAAAIDAPGAAIPFDHRPFVDVGIEHFQQTVKWSWF